MKQYCFTWVNYYTSRVNKVVLHSSTNDKNLCLTIFSLFLDAPFLCYTDNSVILWIVLVIRSSVTMTMWFLWSFYKMLAVITGQTPDLFSRWLWLLLLETRTVAHTTVILDLEFRVGKCSCLSPQAKGNLENGEKYLTIPVQCTTFHIGK